MCSVYYIIHEHTVLCMCVCVVCACVCLCVCFFCNLCIILYANTQHYIYLCVRICMCGIASVFYEIRNKNRARHFVTFVIKIIHVHVQVQSTECVLYTVHHACTHTRMMYIMKVWHVLSNSHDKNTFIMHMIHSWWKFFVLCMYTLRICYFMNIIISSSRNVLSYIHHENSCIIHT